MLLPSLAFPLWLRRIPGRHYSCLWLTLSLHLRPLLLTPRLDMISCFLVQLQSYLLALSLAVTLPVPHLLLSLEFSVCLFWRSDLLCLRVVLLLCSLRAPSGQQSDVACLRFITVLIFAFSEFFVSVSFGYSDASDLNRVLP